MKLSNEAKVGLLLGSTLILTLLLASLLGAQNPFRNQVTLYVTYHFAGGIDVGSPVRVAGIKVGQVEKIDFFEATHEEGTQEVVTPLKVKIRIEKKAASGIRQDSRFYINLAGIIGERYIEITPGTWAADGVKNGDVLRGVDPPRIDQLISQSFDLAGKIKEVIDKNEGNITKSIQLLYSLSSNLNKTLEYVEKSKLFKTDLQSLINNLIAITQDVKVLTSKTQTPEGQKTLKLLHELLWRLEPLKADEIRKFFQKEGIRTRLF